MSKGTERIRIVITDGKTAQTIERDMNATQLLNLFAFMDNLEVKGIKRGRSKGKRGRPKGSKNRPKPTKAEQA